MRLYLDTSVAKGLREKGRGPQPEGDKSGRGACAGEALLDRVLRSSELFSSAELKARARTPAPGRRQRRRAIFGLFWVLFSSFETLSSFKALPKPLRYRF